MSNERGVVGVVRSVLLFALTLGLGCGPRVVNPEPTTTPVGTVLPGAVVASATIGAAGGTLVSADGRVSIVVPAGALSEDKVISVVPITNTAHGGLGNAYRMTGVETFAQPVSLNFSYLDEELEGTAPQFLDVAFQTKDGFWQLTDTTAVVDAAAKTITATTTHFTDYSFVARFRLNPKVVTLKPNQARVFVVEHSFKIEGERPSPGADRVIMGFEWEPVSVTYGSLITSEWSVNGIAGGNATIGTLYADVERGGYAAPEKPPTPNTVTIRVKVTNPAKPEDNGFLESKVTISDDDLPQKYSGQFTYHHKFGGPPTVYLPQEWWVEAQVTYTRSSPSTASYKVTGGSASLIRATMDLDFNCHCTAGGATGVVGDQSALIIARTRDSFTSLGFETIFTGVPIVCTGSTDFACTNPQLQNIGSSAWSLSGVNPACSGMVQDTFTNPREISGSWSVTCPASQMLTVTEATWTLTGID